MTASIDVRPWANETLESGLEEITVPRGSCKAEKFKCKFYWATRFKAKIVIKYPVAEIKLRLVLFFK